MKRLFLLLTFILTTLTGFPQWINQNPVPNGNDLWSTFFIDDNTGWIVGSDGFIKKTTNAGIDWIQQSSSTTLTLRSVQFIDHSTGWICGSSGLILKTTDGGENWFELTSGTSELLTDLHFYDVNIGWAVGYNETIIKTTNGGASWTSQSSAAPFHLNSVDFVDSLVGYAVGKDTINFSANAKILKTTDGGTTWIDKSSILSGYPGINTVEFVDANVGWIGGGSGYFYGFLIKTTDGGDTWGSESIFKSEVTIIRENLLIDYNFGIRSIYFRDSNNGWAVNGGDEYYRAIYTTTNGGANWVQKYFTLEEYDLLSVFVNSIGHGWAVGRNGSIFRTEDDGQSWRQQLSGGVHYGGEEDIYSIFNINENVGWAAGIRDSFSPWDSAVILKTTNSGKTWITKLFNYDYGGIIKTLFFINENIGWAGSNEGLLSSTTDGGENWLGSSVDIQSVSSIIFVDQNTGWLASDNSYYNKEKPELINNIIAKSTDGGITWDQKSSLGGSSIYFSDTNNGWVVGENGSIRKSTDGGETWITKASGITENLNCVKFYNSSLGMCVGNVGTILLSTDSGENWVSKSVGITNDLKSVTFTNSTTAWVVGSNGEILSTADLGNNWIVHKEVTSNNLNSVFFVNENTGWVSGMKGSMFKYSIEPVPPAVWTNQILVEDAGGIESSGVLTFGQHIDATDSIDLSLGEYELPPPPPPLIFDARFNLPTNPEMGSLKDFRDSTKTEIIWTITFQPSSAGYPMSFNWDSLSFPEGTFYLKDRIDGSFVKVNMKNQSSYVLTEPAITSLNISYKGKCSLVSVNNEWNMISVPLLAENMALTNLFPTATSSAYGFDNEYVTEDTLIAGVGYWLKFGGSEELQICGSSLGDTISVQEGWNMFGGYEKDVPITQITSTPSGIIATYFFGYEDGYHIADTLKTGKGYWVRVTSDGILNLNSSGLSKDKEKDQLAKIDQNWGKIKITDNEGKSITLYAAEEEIESNIYELPPVPPAGIFDVRYGSGKLVEALSSEKVILISSDKYPIIIKAEGMDLMVRDKINGELLNEKIKSGEEIRITNNKITSIEITGRISGGLPISYELYQNYPNPFNPSTTIKFSLQKESNVNLSVYNVLGELVLTLVTEQLKPGYYEYEFSASSLASGVYLYRINAGDFVSTKKMILLR
ncbi:MAG: YCF48-related protein [Ignavibacteria bacterium]|nr:YCF48-related protein [Ignavibacteria bacterium]